MVLEDYLSLLSWQGCKIPSQDFKSLRAGDLKSPLDILHIVSFPETKEFLIHNKQWWKKAEEDYKNCKQKSYHILWPGHKNYPKVFTDYLDTPPLLTCLGDLNPELTPITFVGSRKSDHSSVNWMNFYMPDILKEKNISVVSGGAIGIDQKAHFIAVQSGIPTVCFLPSGLDNFYPPTLKSFKKDILDAGGAFVSCFPPHVGMYKSFFHIRNRLMACYSKLVIVIQAQIRSGTMLTAKKALDFGVPVATLPGSPLSTAFSGNLQLLYDGAFLLRDGADLSLLIDSLTNNKDSIDILEGDSRNMNSLS